MSRREFARTNFLLDLASPCALQWVAPRRDAVSPTEEAKTRHMLRGLIEGKVFDTPGRNYLIDPSAKIRHCLFVESSIIALRPCEMIGNIFVNSSITWRKPQGLIK
jgi:hypothetical protein